MSQLKTDANYDAIPDLTHLTNGGTKEVDSRTWPTIRKFLKYWQDEINHELVKQKNSLGKTVIIKIIGDKTKDILDKDKVISGEKLKVEVKVLTQKEIGRMVMEKLLSKKEEPEVPTVDLPF